MTILPFGHQPMKICIIGGSYPLFVQSQRTGYFRLILCSLYGYFQFPYRIDYFFCLLRSTYLHIRRNIYYANIGFIRHTRKQQVRSTFCISKAITIHGYSGFSARQCYQTIAPCQRFTCFRSDCYRIRFINRFILHFQNRFLTIQRIDRLIFLYARYDRRVQKQLADSAQSQTIIRCFYAKSNLNLTL